VSNLKTYAQRSKTWRSVRPGTGETKTKLADLKKQLALVDLQILQLEKGLD